MHGTIYVPFWRPFDSEQMFKASVDGTRFSSRQQTGGKHVTVTIIGMPLTAGAIGAFRDLPSMDWYTLFTVSDEYLRKKIYDQGMVYPTYYAALGFEQ